MFVALSSAVEFGELSAASSSATDLSAASFIGCFFLCRFFIVASLSVRSFSAAFSGADRSAVAYPSPLLTGAFSAACLAVPDSSSVAGVSGISAQSRNSDRITATTQRLKPKEKQEAGCNVAV